MRPTVRCGELAMLTNLNRSLEPRLPLSLIALLGVLVSHAQPALSQTGRGVPYVVDPVTKRIYQYCKNKPRCIAEQHRGIKMFLREITRSPGPSQPRVQLCIRRATSRNLTNWSKAARCLR